jgi:hypothetical protein
MIKDGMAGLHTTVAQAWHGHGSIGQGQQIHISSITASEHSTTAHEQASMAQQHSTGAHEQASKAHPQSIGMASIST